MSVTISLTGVASAGVVGDIQLFGYWGGVERDAAESWQAIDDSQTPGWVPTDQEVATNTWTEVT